MSELKFNPVGFYSSSYFRIYVDTDDQFVEYDTLSDSGAATFLHEYIHFLQDITTTHGLFNIITEVDFIKLFNSKLQPTNVPSINVPFSSMPEDRNTHLNFEMRKIWIGAGQHRSCTGEFGVFNEITNLTSFDGKNTYPLNRIIMQWGNTQDGGIKYSFGSYCISESMAYEIEQVIYPNVLPPSPQLPYSSARIIADKLYPNFSNNVENLIALCDASLMYNDPGTVFYNTLVKMEGTGYFPTIPEDIYEYVYSNNPFNYQGITNPMELFNYASHLTNTQLSDYFSSNIFEANTIWITRTLSAAQNLRQQIPPFILDLVREGDIRSNSIFNRIKNKLGTPIVVNSNNEMFFENILNGYGYKIEPQYFWIFNEFKDLITKQWSDLKTQNLCGLKSFCDKSCEALGIDSFTDYRCYNEPWRRSDDPNLELCWFGAAWKAWGLQGKSLEQNNE